MVWSSSYCTKNCFWSLRWVFQSCSMLEEPSLVLMSCIFPAPYLCPFGLNCWFNTAWGLVSRLLLEACSTCGLHPRILTWQVFAYWFGILARWTLAQLPVGLPMLGASEWNESKETRSQEVYDHRWTIDIQGMNVEVGGWSKWKVDN